MPAWTPEVVVDEAAARRLIARQFPAFAPGALRLLGEGWDMTVWLLDESVWFRFPRREVVVAGLLREMRVLPALEHLLPLPISTPVFCGTPTDDFPWPFAGGQMIPGTEICDAGLDDAGRAALAEPLARFLRRLHSAEVRQAIDAVIALPTDPMGRGDMARRVPWTREALRQLAELGIWRPSSAVQRCLDRAAGLPTPNATVVAHGDLHLRHLLVDHGAAAGVIDWIDVCMASPALDLVLYWALLPDRARGAFIESYGGVGQSELLRARALAFGLTAVLAAYAHQGGHAALERETLAALDRAATG